MKKIYSTPSVEQTSIQTQQMVCTSGVFSDIEIGYGGIDIGGNEEPGSRFFENLIDDEDIF